MLRVKVISQLSPQDRLVEEWSELADACAYSTVFQTAEWLTTWWRVIGRKRRGQRLHIVTMRDGEALVGLVPLILSKWYNLPIARLSFMGAGVTDYNDAIALPDRESEVCAAFFSFLAEHSAEWSLLDLRDLRESGLLRAHAPTRDTAFDYSDFPLETCPYLTIPTDVPVEERWKKLLSGFSKKMRSNVGYYERNLQRAYQMDHQVIQREEDLDEAFENLFELHRRRWNRRWLPGVFSSEKVRAFHPAVAAKLLEKGWLRLHVLSLDGQIQAVLYGFAFHERACYYQGGFEPDLSRYSLGSVLIAKAIQQATNEGFEEFDFLRGNEEYKQRWTGGAYRTNLRRLIARRGTRLKFAEQVHHLENSVETRFKEIFADGIVRRSSPTKKAAVSE